jgi:hypothetical protein
MSEKLAHIATIGLDCFGRQTPFIGEMAKPEREGAGEIIGHQDHGSTIPLSG